MAVAFVIHSGRFLDDEDSRSEARRYPRLAPFLGPRGGCDAGAHRLLTGQRAKALSLINPGCRAISEVRLGRTDD